MTMQVVTGGSGHDHAAIEYVPRNIPQLLVVFISCHNYRYTIYSVFPVGCPEEGVVLVCTSITTAVFISSRFHSAVVTCTNKDNWTTNMKYTV